MKTEWSNYYPGYGFIRKKNLRTYFKRNSSNYYIYHCEFIKQVTNGAVLFSSTTNDTKLLIEDTLFASCSATNCGSLVFSSNGQCVLNRVCGFRSKAEKYYQFCHIKVTPDDNFQNKIIQSSISYSGDNSDTGSHCIKTMFGELLYKYLNISFTRIYQVSNFQIQASGDNSAVIFSNFVNNSKNNQSSASYFYSQYVLKNASHAHCNLISISGPATFSGLVGSENVYLKVSNCCFYDIEGYNRYFYTKGPISRIEANRCFFDQYFGTNETVTIENNLTESSFVSIMQIKTDNCRLEEVTNIVYYSSDNMLFEVFIATHLDC